MVSKAQKLRKLFTSPGMVRIVGAHHALGAKLIEKNGFEGIWASGLEISAAHAVPDANILTMTDYLSAAISMNEASSLPVVCDCDTGYGNFANVWHMIKKYEAAGIAGVVIEDKLFPKVNSFIAGRQELAAIEEFCGKIEAAKSARQDQNFMIFARVEALIAGWGMEEALKRAKAYAAAGADGIVIHSKAKNPEEIFEFASRWDSNCPLVCIPTMYPDVTASSLEKKGFKMVIYANHGLRASIRAIDETLKSIATTGSTIDIENKITPLKEVFSIQGMDTLKAHEKKFAGKEIIQTVLMAAGKPAAEFNSVSSKQPLCMTDAGGRTLLDRQCETLRSAGVNDIIVVGGFCAEVLRADAITVIKNDAYSSTGIAFSMMTAKSLFKNKCVISFSDIVYDRIIIEKLLTSPHDVTIVVDRAYRNLPYRDKNLDLVIVEDAEKSDHPRRIQYNPFKRVSRIGRKNLKEKANCEFIGLAFLNTDGIDKVKTAWSDALKKFSGKAFYEAASVEQADMTDFLQHLIDSGCPVHAIEIEHGWSEIHSLADLERVRSHFTQNTLLASKL